MDRKHRVWLIVLLVLFLAAVAGVIVVRQQLNDSRADYAAAHIQLTTEQENVAALQSELQAAEEEAQQLSADLEAQAAETESQQKAAEEAQARVAQLEADLETSEAKVAELETDLEMSGAKVAELEADLETSEAKVAELETGLSDAQAKIAELESQPTAEPSEPTAAPDATQTPQSTDGLETPSLQAFAGRMSEIMDSELSDAEKLMALAEMEAELSGEATASQDVSDAEDAAQMEADLAQAQSAVAELEGQLAASGEEMERLQAQIDTLSAQSETDAAALEELEAQLAQAQETSAALEAELAAAREDYERRLNELEAYMLRRDLTEGEAMTSTDAASTIRIAADGVTGAWSYTNRTVSGNTVVLSLSVDGEELYRSEPLAPGEGIEQVELSRPLAPGTYAAEAVTRVLDAQGVEQFASRVVVTLEVAE